MQCARTKLLHGTINFAKQKNNLLYNNTLNTFIMKLKSIIALALVALMASCTLNSRLRKLEKAAEDGDAKKAVEILEKIEKKYDEPKDWNREQVNRLGCAIQDLRDHKKVKAGDMEDVYEIYLDIYKNLD